MKTIVASLTFLILLAGCGGEQQKKLKPNDDAMPVVTVGGDTLRLKDFKNYLRLDKYKNLDVSDAQQRKKVLNDLIQEKLIEQYAYAEKINEQWSVRRKVNDERDEILYKKSVKINVYYPLITETMMRDYYEQLKDELHVKQIFIGHTEITAQMNLKEAAKYSRSREKAKKLADSLYRAVLNKPDQFESIAAEFSNDEESKAAGGDLGFVRLDAIDLTFQETIGGLNIGQISKPVEAQSGYHIFKLIEKRKTDNIKPYDDLKNIIKDRLFYTLENNYRKEIQARLAQFGDSLLAAFEFKIDEASVQLFLKRYQTVKTPGDITGVFSNDERALKLATYKDGAIIIDELIGVMQDNRKKVELDAKRMSDGLKKIAMTRILAAYAPQQGLTLTPDEEAYIHNYQTKMMIELAKKANVEDKVDYAEVRLKNHYETNEAHFRTLSVVTLAAIQSSNADAIKGYLTAIRGGETFESVYEKAAKDTAAKCQKIGPVQDDRKNELVAYAAQMKPGDVSDPITTQQGGYSIIKLLQKDEGRLLPYDRVKDLVRSDYEVNEKRKLYTQWIDQLKVLYPVQVFEKNFDEAYNIKLK